MSDFRRRNLTILGGAALISVGLAGAALFQESQATKSQFTPGEFLPGFDQALVPGPATTVQVMVKDSKKYPASGGWGFGKFIEGKPVDEAEHRTCFTCHETHVKNHDYVFTRFAP